MYDLRVRFKTCLESCSSRKGRLHKWAPLHQTCLAGRQWLLSAFSRGCAANLRDIPYLSCAIYHTIPAYFFAEVVMTEWLQGCSDPHDGCSASLFMFSLQRTRGGIRCWVCAHSSPEQPPVPPLPKSKNSHESLNVRDTLFSWPVKCPSVGSAPDLDSPQSGSVEAGETELF